MKRLFLFLPPPLTHPRPSPTADCRGQRPTAALAGERVELVRGWKNTRRTSGPMATYALAAAEEFTMATGGSGGGMRADDAARAREQQMEV